MGRDGERTTPMTTPTAPTGAAPPAPAGRGRDAAVDNARFVLITLVVIGHALTSMRSSAVIDVVYTWIYLFHMPAFVFLAGLVIRRDSVDPGQGRKLISTLVAPLVIFTVLFQGLSTALGTQGPIDEGLLDPYWALWFIAALLLWRLSVPVLRALRWPVATTVVLATALSVAVDLPAVLSIDRFVVLAPFFAAGLALTPARIAGLRRVPWRVAALGVLVLSGFAATWAVDLPRGFILFTDGVGTGDGGLAPDVVAFLAVYLIAAAMTAALLALIPRTTSLITVWGARTIYVYLLHGFVIRVFRASPLDATMNTPVGWAMVVVASVALTVALSSDRAVRLAKPLVEPRVGWLLRGERAARTPGAPGTAT